MICIKINEETDFCNASRIAIIEEEDLDDDNNVVEDIQSLDEQDEATEHTTP